MATHLLNPRLWVAYIQALRLVLAAQAVAALPLTQVIKQLTSRRHLPYRPSIADSLRASRAASRHLGRVGYLDTCLIQALVLGTLVCDSHKVELVIGFRPAAPRETQQDIAGHAWLTIDGRPYLQEAETSDYVKSRSFAIKRA